MTDTQIKATGKTIVVERGGRRVTWYGINNEFRQLVMQRRSTEPSVLINAIKAVDGASVSFQSTVTKYRKILRDARRIYSKEELRSIILKVLPEINDLRAFLASLALEEQHSPMLRQEDYISVYSIAKEIAEKRKVYITTPPPSETILIYSPWILGLVMPGRNTWEVTKKHGRKIPYWELLEAEIRDLERVDEAKKFVSRYMMKNLLSFVASTRTIS